MLDGCSFFYKTWFDKGVYLIQDLLGTDGKVMSYAKFKEKYLLRCHVLTFFQVISAIPKKFIESAKVTSLEKTDFLSKNVFPLSSEICVNLLKMKNKDFYKLLMNKDKIQLKASTKWARDLQVDHIPLESYFGDIKTICKDNKLREFYFKFLHRIIVTKKELFLYGQENNMLCSFCQMNDSIIHTFQNCYWTKQFFSEVIKWFNAENATSLSFSRIEIMFGRKLNKKNAEQYPERKLNFTLLFAKYYLYNTKLTHGEISMSDFITKVNYKYSLEGLNVWQ